jgi:hypothetical protein
MSAPLPHYGKIDEPDLMTEQANDPDNTYELQTIDGPLFNGAPSPDDIHQGQAGDCYFLSSLAAIANSEPSSFKHLIYDNHDGTYTVTFHGWNEKTQSFDPYPVKVDAKFWVSHPKGDPSQSYVTYDSGVPRGMNLEGDPVHPALWGPLLEKAFAQVEGGGFDAIGNGGWASDAMEALLGRTATQLDVTASTPEQVWARIQSAVDTRSPICAGTYCDPEHQAMYTNTGVVGQHAYTVLGAEMRDGERYVTLRNPWGNTEPAGNGADDGVFQLKLSDFLRYYATVDVCPRS